MSVPFSNTHLRVPRGFGTILEGLAREILRDQPEDIPTYAAHYFEALLKQREESGIDPAAWAAKLEDRFYNNHSFKAHPVEESTTETTTSKEKSNESQTDDSSRPNVPDEENSTESGGEDGKIAITDEDVSVGKELSQEESGIRLPPAGEESDEQSGTEEEEDQSRATTDQVETTADEKDSGSVRDEDVLEAELEPDLSSLSVIASADVCAKELGMAEDEEDQTVQKKDTAVVEEEFTDSGGEERAEMEESMDVSAYSGLADVDVCAEELGRTEPALEGRTVDEHVNEDESSLLQTEETEDQAPREMAHAEEGLECDASPKEDTLVEVNFEDVPEAQGIAEVLEREDSVEVPQADVSVTQQRKDSREFAEEGTDNNTQSAKDLDEPKMEGAEQEVDSRKDQMKVQQEPSDTMTEKVDTSDSDSNDSGDDEKGKGVENISLAHETIAETEEETEEDGTKTVLSDHKNDEQNNETISEGKSEEFQREKTKYESDDLREDETTDIVGEDKEDAQGPGKVGDESRLETSDGGEKTNVAQVTQSNTSSAGMEAQRETLEEVTERPPEESEERQRTLAEPQTEDTPEETEVTPEHPEESAESGQPDSGVQESDALWEEGSSIVPAQSADQTDSGEQGEQGEQRPLGSEKDAEAENRSPDKQEECSRPVEEEDIMDIPLDDPEANRAAAKIQAGFRGHMTRKKMKPEDKAEGEEVSSSGEALNGSQGVTETGGSGAVESDVTSVPEQ